MTATALFMESGEILEAHVEGQRRNVEVTIIKAGPGNPKNRHFYSAQMLEAATPQFAGAHIYADHEHDFSLQRKRGGVRSTKDLVGVIRETWWDPTAQAVKGKATILRNWVWEIVEADPTILGLSLSGSAGKVQSGKIAGALYNIVESIREVKSVDLVTRAGAGGKIERILESMQEDTMALEAITLDDLKEHRSDLIEAAMAERDAAADAPQTITVEEHEAKLAEAAKAAADEARAKAIEETEARIASEREAEDRRRANATAVSEALAEAGLPERTSSRIKREFEAKISEGDMPTEELHEALQSAVKEAKEELAEVAGSGEVKGMGGQSLDESGASTKSKDATDSIHAQVVGAIAPPLEA